MKFVNLQAGHLFWLAAGLVVFYLAAYSRRKKITENFAQKELLKELSASLDIQKRKLKIYLVVLAVILCFFAFMRPQWGFQWEQVRRRGLDIIIAIDTSKSMLAEDVRPNRLQRSKLAVKDLIKKLRGDRIGLIAFSGTAFLQCPLTVDYNGFMLSLDELDTDSIPKGGTSISSAIKEAIKSYEGGLKKYKVLVLITDGEDHDGDVLESAEEAKKQGIKIFCIGIGTKEGELIPVRDEQGRMSFLKDKQENFIKSRLDEASLKKIALATQGGYVKATAFEFGLDTVYEQRLSKMEKKEFEGKMRKRYEERFQVFLLIAFLILLIEPYISERKKNDYTD
ncbi:MAG: VWA domain-containing protein [Candidatus Omnitrophota bacterium]